MFPIRYFSRNVLAATDYPLWVTEIIKLSSLNRWSELGPTRYKPLIVSQKIFDYLCAVRWCQKRFLVWRNHMWCLLSRIFA